MGAVWQGHDSVLDRPVAIKRVGAAPDRDASENAVRAEREARLAAALPHPDIIGVFDLVEDGDQRWLVMEYVAGQSLADLVRSQGPVPPAVLVPILARCAAALAAAHEQGIVHRDVKPSNILVGDDGTVRLTDFGIARALTDVGLTQTGLVTGSPAYLAPEVASGASATTASDVWSLGATLFHGLVGRPPYEVGDDVLGTMYRIVHEEPPRLDDGSSLDALLSVTMVRDAGRRWSMAQVAQQLAALAAADQSHQVPAAILPLTPASGPPGVTRVDVTHHLPADPPRASHGSRRRAALPLVVGGMMALLITAIVVLLVQADPQDAALPMRGSETSQGVEDEETDPADTPSSPSTQAPTNEQMENFIESYLATASSNPSQGFAQLTPEFQRRSPGYQNFWGSVRNPRLLDFEADPEKLTVTYRYRYNLVGKGLRVDTVNLQLVAVGDSFRIAAEPRR